MAGRRDMSHEREQSLRQRALDVENMLRQMQNVRCDTTPGSRGRSGRMGYGHHPSRYAGPRDGSDFRGNMRRGRSNYRGQNWRGSTRGHRAPPEWSWSYQAAQPSDYSPGYGSTGQFTPHNLVNLLVSFPTFSASLLQLMEEMRLHPALVREIALANSQVFHMNGEAVELNPQVSICTAHPGPQGCSRHLSCKDLHICPDYVYKWCKDKNCALGHRWHTDHNISVLKSVFLEHLQARDLHRLVQSLSKLSNPEQLDVCHKYNGGGCSQSDCNALHVCISYVTGLTRCSRDGCQLNHDLFSRDCSHLLRTHGLSTNEAPRDIVVALLAANPILARQEHSVGRREKYPSLACHQTPEKGTKNVSRRLNERYKEQRTKKTDDTTKVGNLKKGGEYIGSENESSTSRNNSEGSSSSSDEENKTKLTGSHKQSKKKGQSKKGTHATSESEASSQPESESDSESSSYSEPKHAKKTSGTKRRVKLKKGRHSKSDDNYSSSQTENESDSDQSDLNNPPSSGTDQSQSDKNKTKKKQSKRKVSKDKIPGSSDQKIPPAPINNTPQNKPVIRRTCWSHYLQSDVPVLEICYYSVESMCRNEGNGCQRLHSSQHFHWQITGEGSRWFNLRPYQVTCLERSYCDPSQDGVDIPRLDPAALEISVSGLLIILGRDSWYADFKAMNLTNSAKTKTLQMRRLCTETISGEVIKPSNFIWYFMDKNQKWVQYGKVDTVGETTLVSSVTSDDIEKHFNQIPLVSMSFKNSKFTYVLDFSTMQQTNQRTRVSREVRRRPEPHLPDEKAETDDKKTSKDLPSDWETMQPEERMRLVTIPSSSSEYQTVVGLLQQTVPSSNVMKIERIQNPYLWRALQNKIKEMTTIYGDASKVDIRQVFHGTKADVVSSICAENFDWRLHGSSTGQAYGRGTYFATNASYSYGYCRVDSNNMKYLFVVRTAVGTMTKGNASMVRPPLNSATNSLFDSTVDSLPIPSIIVKYDKQEYYPEYLITLT